MKVDATFGTSGWMARNFHRGSCENLKIFSLEILNGNEIENEAEPAPK